MNLNLRIGLVGFGIMGQGIALTALMSGHSVIVKSSDYNKLLGQKDSFLNSAKKHLKRNPELTISFEDASQNIKFSDSYSDFSGCDFIIEAVDEDLSIKAGILTELSKVVSEKTIIASNTSSISITKLSNHVAIPSNFVGIHFMNPVPVIPLVEIIKGFSTSDATYQKSVDFVLSLKKKYIQALDFPGFVLNRILIPMINEAIFLLYEGVATAADIDEALKSGANHPMGPLALADLIGLDTCLAIMNVLAVQFGDSKYRPCPLLINYVNAGWLGKKTNKGFYDYTSSGRPATWPLKIEA